MFCGNTVSIYSYLFFIKKKSSERILFKGGTALRLIYNSPRFSEDLDFSGFNIGDERLETLFLNTLIDIETTGIKVFLKGSKVTSGGYLGILTFEALGFRDEIRIEVSLRSRERIKGELNLINSDYLPAFNIISLPEKQMVEEKIKALLERAKPRDFFDIYFLLRVNLSIEKSKLDLSEVANKLEKMRDIDFKEELKLLLPKSQHMILKDFKNILRRELKRYGY